ncbi:MAG: TetR family transcriptional regulator [Lachnospiraceae bacterium]
MPSQRFYRLPEEKQLAIRDAAIQEFLRVPFEKVSINKIIQAANISRGSFYTYFEDKRDVIRYIFQDVKERAQKVCEDSLERTTGDYWTMVEDLYEHLTQYFLENQLMQLFRNTLVYTGSEDFFPCPEHKKKLVEGDDSDQIFFNRLDQSGMKIRSLEEFRPLHGLCMTSIAVSMSQLYVSPGERAYISQLFHKKLEMIRYGVCIQQNR